MMFAHLHSLKERTTHQWKINFPSDIILIIFLPLNFIEIQWCMWCVNNTYKCNCLFLNRKIANVSVLVYAPLNAPRTHRGA